MTLITRFKRFAPFLIRFFPQMKGFFGEANQSMGGNYGEQTAPVPARVDLVYKQPRW